MGEPRRQQREKALLLPPLLGSHRTRRGLAGRSRPPREGGSPCMGSWVGTDSGATRAHSHSSPLAWVRGWGSGGVESDPDSPDGDPASVVSHRCPLRPHWEQGAGSREQSCLPNGMSSGHLRSGPSGGGAVSQPLLFRLILPKPANCASHFQEPQLPTLRPVHRVRAGLRVCLPP